MDVTFAEHLDLLDLHGRAAVASLSQLDASHTLPPHDTPVETFALEHWATLEVWAWCLAHPDQHWSDRAAAPSPGDHAAVVIAIGAELTRLEDLLQAAGPHAPLDFFGQPGTSADVARLLAHEAVTTAHAASLAAGRSAPTLRPEVAADGVDRALRHWAEPEADVAWVPRPALLRTTGTEQTWLLTCGTDRRGDVAALRLGGAGDGDGEPAAVVEGPDTSLLWWLHDHEARDVVVDGDPDVVRVLREALGHRVAPAPRRRGWWRG